MTRCTLCIDNFALANTPDVNPASIFMAAAEGMDAAANTTAKRIGAQFDKFGRPMAANGSNAASDGSVLGADDRKVRICDPGCWMDEKGCGRSCLTAQEIRWLRNAEQSQASDCKKR